MTRLRVIVYVSAAVVSPTGDELEELLSVAREHNGEAGVTGLLLHADGNFLQYIEGEGDRLAPIWASIRQDPRHHRVTLLLDAPTDVREFDGWSMAFGATDLPVFLKLSATGWHPRSGGASDELSPGRALIREIWSSMLPGH